MEKKVLDFIEQKDILSGVSDVVLAVSGGADSMALAHFMLEHFPQYRYIIAHVNHGLREEAAGEEAFVKAFAEERGAVFRCYRADVAALAKERKRGIEETGREERYRFFRSLGADRILTAHHKDDLAETILFHIIRGSGLKGLGGMEPVCGDLARPLLSVTKREILDYCERHDIEYKTDASNEDTLYTRNKIRKEVMPLLETINPNVTEALWRLAEGAAADNACLDEIAREYYNQYSYGKGGYRCVPAAAMAEAGPALGRRMVRMAAAEFGAAVDFGRTEEIRGLGNGKCLPITKGLWVCRDADVYVFGPKRRIVQPMAAVELPRCGRLEAGNLLVETRAPKKSDRTSVHDCGIFAVDDLFEELPEIRTRRIGDFVVLPDGKKKKLSDYFIDEKIAAGERDGILLLASGRRVLWVVGHRFFARPGKDNLIVNITVKS